jgi:hypothetical protein
MVVYYSSILSPRKFHFVDLSVSLSISYDQIGNYGDDHKYRYDPAYIEQNRYGRIRSYIDSDQSDARKSAGVVAKSEVRKSICIFWKIPRQDLG